VSVSSKKANRVNGRTVTWVVGLVLIVGLVVYYFLRPVQATAVYASTLRQSTPLVLGALCGLIGERSGVINIGIEGQMLMAAFLAFIANVYLGQLGIFPQEVTLFLAVIVGILSGGLLGLFLAWMSIGLKMDQIIGGTVINGLAVGLTSFFYVAGLTTLGKIQVIQFTAFIYAIPRIGAWLESCTGESCLISTQIFKMLDNAPLTYLTILLVFFVQFALFRTVWGLRTRSVGEHPSAADSVGIRVNWMRYFNVTLAGCFAGLAGAYLTLEAVGSFERNMVNGRGFVALAVMLFGKRTPLGSWGAALLFGFASAVQTQLQFSGTFDIPHQFIGMLPYVLTILVLAGFVGRTRDPKALGQVYETE
jgi:simple sugar transport system permease protein